MSANISFRKKKIRERICKHQKRELRSLVRHERNTLRNLLALGICFLLALMLFISVSLVYLVR